MKTNKSNLKGNFAINMASKKEAVIDIEGTIGFDWWEDEPDANTKEAIKQQLKDIAAIKADHITVNINSFGGDVNHGLSIHDLLAEHPAKVTTKIYGMTASAATVIAMAGNERLMSANALGLIHEARNGVYGTSKQQSENIKFLEKVNDRIASIYSKAGGKDEKIYRKQMKIDSGEGEWQNAEEFKEMGLITNIFEPTKVAADFSKAKKYHLPEVPKNKLKSIINIKAEKMEKEKGGKKNPKNKGKASNGGKWAKAINARLDDMVASLTGSKGTKDVEKIKSEVEELKANFQKGQAKNKKLKNKIEKSGLELAEANANIEKLTKKLAKAEGKPLATKKAKKGEDPKADKNIDSKMAAEKANQKALGFTPKAKNEKKD